MAVSGRAGRRGCCAALVEETAETREYTWNVIRQRPAAAYAANLQQNLAPLIEHLKSGRYRAPPVRRHHIPKASAV